MPVFKPGQRLGCSQCGTELITVRPSEQDASIACGGVTLVDVAEAHFGSGHPRAVDGEGPEIGKRYVDDAAGLELLCTRAGQGQLTCDGRPMLVKGAKPLPASD